MVLRTRAGSACCQADWLRVCPPMLLMATPTSHCWQRDYLAWNTNGYARQLSYATSTHLSLGSADKRRKSSSLFFQISRCSSENGDASTIQARASSPVDLACSDDQGLYVKPTENVTNESKPAPEEEAEKEQINIERWAGQAETRRAARAYQQASRLLEAVTHTLDGLEDGLAKRQEELGASVSQIHDRLLGMPSEESEGEGQSKALLLEVETQALNNAAQLAAEVEQLHADLACRDVLLELLQKEAILSSKSLQMATQAMVAARRKMSSLQEQLDSTIGFQRQAEDCTPNTLALSSKALLALSVADDQVKELEQQVERGKNALQLEMEISATAVQKAVMWEQTSQVAEAKVRDLLSEIATLQGLVQSKEKTVLAIREEAWRNSNMLMSASKTRDAVNNAEKRVELLSAHVMRLEEEVRSRDALLEEIKNETVCSTDALRLAAQIKQDLNASKERELELSQQVDSHKVMVKELQQELGENHRAVRAEQALRQMEKLMKDVNIEVEVLRKGVEARDQALRLMKDEVDRSVDVLSHAAENREVMEQMRRYVEELRAELKSKDAKLADNCDELATAINYGRQQQPEPMSTLLRPLPIGAPSPAVEMPKSKGKLSRHRQGNTRRPSPEL